MHHHLDVYAYTNALRPLPPTQKVGFALGMLTLALVGQPVTQGVIGLWMSRWILGAAGIPLAVYGSLVGGMVLFWLASLPALVVEVAPMTSAVPTPGVAVGAWWVSLSGAGMTLALGIGLRGLATGVCLLFLLLTVPFAELLQVLRGWRLPAILLDILLLMYRFIFLALEELVQMQLAQRARGGDRHWRRRMYSLGLLTSQLVVRSLQRYQGFRLGLAARGFAGSLRVEPLATYRRCRRYEWEVLVGVVALLTGELYLRWVGV